MSEKNDILFQIDMQLYDEFNEKFCKMIDNLGIIYNYRDLNDLEKLEKETEIKLLREAIKKQQKEMKDLKDKIKEFREIDNIDLIHFKIKELLGDNTNEYK